MPGQFSEIQGYNIQEKSSKTEYRLFGFFTDLSYGAYDPNQPKAFAYYALTKDGLKYIRANEAILVPLKWYKKDVGKAGIMGGIVGTLLSILIQLIIFYGSK